MEEKKFSKFELAKMKRTAQNVDQYLRQKAKLEEQINQLNVKLDSINQLIELNDAPTRALTGYSTSDLFKKVIAPTGKIDKNGNPIKVTKFEFIYPDTIIPPITDGEKCVYEDVNPQDEAAQENPKMSEYQY